MVHQLPDVYKISALLLSTDGAPMELWLRNDKGFPVRGEIVTLSINSIGLQTHANIARCHGGTKVIEIDDYDDDDDSDSTSEAPELSLAQQRWDAACSVVVKGSLTAVSDSAGHVIFRDIAILSAVPGTYDLVFKAVQTTHTHPVMFYSEVTDMEEIVCNDVDCTDAIAECLPLFMNVRQPYGFDDEYGNHYENYFNLERVRT